MKFATSYFAQIRKFKPHMIPISTAKWSPKWFISDHPFVDKNGVLNGIECKLLVPGSACDGLCSGKPCKYNPESCEFLHQYRRQLFNTPIEHLFEFTDKVAYAFEKAYRIERSKLTLVFMVYETNDNPCSERSAIQDYIRFYGLHDCDELNI